MSKRKKKRKSSYLWEDAAEANAYLDGSAYGEPEDETDPRFKELLDSFDKEEDRLGYLDKPVLGGVKVVNADSKTTSYGNTYHGASAWKSKCIHAGEEVLVTIEGIRYRGAAKLDINRAVLMLNKTVVVNLTSMPLAYKPAVRLAELPDEFKLLAKHNVHVKEVLVDWTDMESPLLKREFWPHLHDIAKTNGYTDILFCCLGGHGRTGTALASTLISLCGMDPFNAAATVRGQLCRDCIETTDQVEYLYYVHNQTETPSVLSRRYPEPSMWARSDSDRIVMEAVASSPAKNNNHTTPAGTTVHTAGGVSAR